MPGIHAGGALAAMGTIDSPLTPALVALAGGRPHDAQAIEDRELFFRSGFVSVTAP